MSNGMIHVQRSFREIARALNKFRLVESWFWIQGPVAADTSHSGTIFEQSDARRHTVSWILVGWKLFHCAMYLLPLDLVSKNQLSTNQNLFNACVISVLSSHCESWFWIQCPVAADTSHSGTIFEQSDARRHTVSWILVGWKLFHCAMYLLPLDLVSKNQLSTNQNLFNACVISVLSSHCDFFVLTTVLGVTVIQN